MITISETPYEHDISVRRGDTLRVEFLLEDVDYTGYTFKCEVRDRITKRHIMTMTPIFEGYAAGDSTISLSKSATQTDVRAGSYMYDIAAIDELDQDYDIIYGLMNISDDVTLNIPNLLEDDDGGIIVG